MATEEEGGLCNLAKFASALPGLVQIYTCITGGKLAMKNLEIVHGLQQARSTMYAVVANTGKADPLQWLRLAHYATYRAGQTLPNINSN